MPTFNLCVCLFLSNLWKIGKWTTSPLDDTPSRHSGAPRSICFELEELKDFLHIPWWLVDGEASTIGYHGRVIQGDPGWSRVIQWRQLDPAGSARWDGGMARLPGFQVWFGWMLPTSTNPTQPSKPMASQPSANSSLPTCVFFVTW